MRSVTSPRYTLKSLCFFYGQSPLEAIKPVFCFGFVLYWEKKAEHFENSQQDALSCKLKCSYASEQSKAIIPVLIQDFKERTGVPALMCCAPLSTQPLIRAWQVAPAEILMPQGQDRKEMQPGTPSLSVSVISVLTTPSSVVLLQLGNLQSLGQVLLQVCSSHLAGAGVAEACGHLRLGRVLC